MTGIKAVQAYRREPRNQQIFEDIADRYRVDNERTFKLLAIFMPGVKLVGNRELLGQALVNLIENALKYYEPAEGKVVFRHHRRRRRLAGACAVGVIVG